MLYINGLLFTYAASEILTIAKAMLNIASLPNQKLTQFLFHHFDDQLVLHFRLVNLWRWPRLSMRLKKEPRP